MYIVNLEQTQGNSSKSIIKKNHEKDKNATLENMNLIQKKAVKKKWRNKRDMRNIENK